MATLDVSATRPLQRTAWTVPPDPQLLSLVHGFADYFHGLSALAFGAEAAAVLAELGAAQVRTIARGEVAPLAVAAFALLPGRGVTPREFLTAWHGLRAGGVLMTTGGIGYRAARRLIGHERHYFLPLGPGPDGRVRPFRPPLWGSTPLLIQRAP